MATKKNVTNLIPIASQVSFYGKAKVITEDVNGMPVKYLQSYETIVAMYVNGVFVRLWDGYSATTMRHINSFRLSLGLTAISKKEWCELDTDYTLVTSDVLQPFNWNRVAVNYGMYW